MKNLPIILVFLLLVGLIGYLLFSNQSLQKEISKNSDSIINPNEKETSTEIVNEETDDSTQIANPASVFCVDKGYDLKIVSNNDGSQFGICMISDSQGCEEWAYYRGECNFETDAKLIYDALVDKGLDLSLMQVKITTHLGKYISGSVNPISAPAGGGYVFAAKENENVIIVADGNGTITCEMLKDYEDFPTFLIPECFDDVNEVMVVR